MKYLKKFDQHTQYDSYIESEDYLKPNVSYCEEHNNIHHSEKDHTIEYLTFTALEDGTFTFTIGSNVGTSFLSYVEYSVDDRRTWVKTNNENSTTITITTPTVKSGEKVFWRGNASKLFNNSGSTINYRSCFSSTCRCTVRGNIGMLLSITDPNNYTDFSSTFMYTFADMSTLVDASDLYLPLPLIVTTVYGTAFIYGYLFQNCTALISGPKELNSLTSPASCYSHMFSGCTSLRIPPKLPAMTLSSSCYEYMFENCTSLITAPELPATTIVGYCYQYMFSGCSSLKNPPKLNAMTAPYGCYGYMFQNCTSLITAPELPATTLEDFCYRYMFNGCTNMISGPSILPATYAGNSGTYYYMFNNCTSLINAPELPAIIDSDNKLTYQDMFVNCTSLVKAPELPTINMDSSKYTYYEMFRGCTSLKYVKALFVNSPSDSSARFTRYWVQNVSSTGIFVKNINATWTTTGNHGVPTNWTILYFDPSTNKYYLSDKTTECDDHGNPI